MNVKFGNLSVDRFEERLGIKLSDDDKKYLEKHRIDKADFTEEDGLHIFDLPFEIECGGLIADDIVNLLTKYNDESPFKKHLMVSSRELVS